METTIIAQLLDSISFSFIAIVCLLTYGVIKTIQGIIGCEISRLMKSIVALIAGIIMCIIYIVIVKASIETVLLSFLICTFGYDIILKPIIKCIEHKIKSMSSKHNEQVQK